MKSKPLFPAKTLDQIPVADKPLRQGGKIEYLTAKQFQERFGLEYVENMWGTEKQAETSNQAWQDGLNNKNKLTKDELNIIERVNNPFADMAICFIDEKVGYGIFAQKDIPAGTILGIYSGDLVKDKQDFDTYDYSFDPVNKLKIDAKKRGGIIRFMQHLPIDFKKYRPKLIENLKQPAILADLTKVSITQAEQILKKNENNDQFLNSVIDELIEQKVLENELADIDFVSSEDKLFNIATCNVDLHKRSCCGLPMLVVTANYLIKAGDQIGFPYGKEYWQRSYCNPELFHIDGIILPHSLYKRKIVHLSFSDSTHTNTIPIDDTTQSFLNDIEENAPLSIETTGKQDISLSIYDVRDKLAQANAVDEKRFGSFSEASTPVFALALKNKFANAEFKEVIVKTYYQNPVKTTVSADGHTVDVVCKAPDQQKLKSLTRFFNPIKNRIKVFEETNEIVITSTNVIDDKNDENFKEFFNTLRS